MRVYYTPTQFGYNPANAPEKFIRMRLNHGILPLSSIRGGKCAGRSDGLCPLADFVESEKNAFNLSNYQYVPRYVLDSHTHWSRFACFGNYTVDNAKHPGKDFDGTIQPGDADNGTTQPGKNLLAPSSSSGGSNSATPSGVMICVILVAAATVISM
jgi:hypothetical protein